MGQSRGKTKATNDFQMSIGRRFAIEFFKRSFVVQDFKRQPIDDVDSN